MNTLKRLAAPVALFLVFSGVVSAQNRSAAAVSNLPPELAKMSNVAADGYVKMANCFDFYKLNSVKVRVAPENGQAIASGSEIKFSGSVQNTNPYPIVGGAVYVKIYRNGGVFADPAKNSKAAAGSPNDLVAQFSAVQNLNIAPGGQAPISFAWKLPNFAMSGNYYIVGDFAVGNKFYLSGIPYSDGIIGSRSDFAVAGAQNDGLIFDRTSVKVNGEKYDSSSYSPRVDKAKPIAVTFNLDNLSGKEIKTLVTYALYKNDDLAAENDLGVNNEVVAVPAHSSKALAYAITDVNHAAYYLVAKAGYNDAESVIGVRAVREGVNELQINYAAAPNYPLKSGSENAVSACVSNISGGEVSGSKVVLSLLGQDGKTLWSGSYSGMVDGAMFGLSGVFKSSNLSDFSFKTDVYQDGKLSDSATLTYDCKSIDPKLCASPVSLTTLLVIVGILLVVSALIYWILERKKLK